MAATSNAPWRAPNCPPNKSKQAAHAPIRIRYVASGYWSGTDTFELTLRFIETTFCNTWTCRFGDDGRVTIATRQNVAFGPNEGPTLVGQVKR